MIERYGLYRYDHGEGDMAELDTEFIMHTLSSTHVINKTDGRYFIIAFPGDTYASLGTELGIDAGMLEEVNGGKEIKDWCEVYLQ